MKVDFRDWIFEVGWTGNFREILEVSLLYLYPDRLATANFIGREHNLSGQNLQPEKHCLQPGKALQAKKKGGS